MSVNQMARLPQLFALVDGAALPGRIQPLLESAGVPFRSVYVGLPEEQLGAASLFVARIDSSQAEWVRELEQIDLHHPCLVMIWSYVDLPDLAAHLRAFLFADIGDGMSAMIRFFDPRNIDVVLRVWGTQIQDLFMAPIDRIKFRGRHEQWHTIANRSDGRGRTSKSVIVELSEADIDTLVAHTETDELMASLIALEHIDAELPYRSRFLDFQPRYQRAVGWGLTDSRDRLAFCERTYRYGLHFDQNASVREGLMERRRSEETFEDIVDRIPKRVWNALQREHKMQASLAKQTTNPVETGTVCL